MSRPTHRIEALYRRALAAARLPPARERLDFAVRGMVLGSIEPADAQLLAAALAGLSCSERQLSVRCAPTQTSTVLGQIAVILQEAGRLDSWRDEQLAVLAPDDTPCGHIERAAVRALGLRTIAVHLVGWRHDGRMWIQRRATDKAVDPGRLDTLAGGLVGLDQATGRWHPEPLATAMRREADEEAGVDFELPAQVPGAPLRVGRPVSQGYMVEDLVTFEAVVDDRFRPRNRDGEVAGFECLAAGEVVDAIERGAFTLEASLVILSCLRRAAAADGAATGG